MIEIEGSKGGGQLLRTSLALSAITGKKFKMTNIRGSRKNPGLKEQHLKCIQLVSQLCRAKIKGDKLGSKDLLFEPGRIGNKDITISVRTAGSIGLLLQSVHLPASFSDSVIKINVNGGATYGKWSPPVDYISNILSPIIKDIGFDLDIDIKKHGFYPKGGANVTFVIKPLSEGKVLRKTEPGKIKSIKGLSIASKHLKKANVAERQAKAVMKNIDNNHIDISEKYVDSNSPGSGVVLWAECSNTVLGADSIGERGKSAEKVGTDAAKSLLNTIEKNCCFDKFAADQIINYASLSSERNSFLKVEKITNHCKTNSEIIEKFLPVAISFRADNIIKISRI